MHGLFDRQALPILEFLCTPTQAKRHFSIGLFVGSSIGVLFLGTYKMSTVDWHFYVALYVIAILLPIVLGMMERIRFRWVLLWEAVLLFPLSLIALLLFGGALIAVFRNH